MKRYRLFQNIGLLTAMSFALVSCFKDELVGSRVNSRSNIIGFGISAATTADGTPLTRATQYADSALLMLGRGGADTLYLHASSENNISALDTSVATRGVPVNSSNFSTVCKNFSVSAFTPTGDYYMKNVKVDNLANGIWSSDEEHFWPEDEEMTLDFFAYAPAVFGENPVFAEDDIQYKPSDSNGKIMSFDYTVPGSGESVTNAAELQPDIMFAYSSQNKKATDPATGSVPLKFYHALAGVKFVAKDITGGTVKSITLKNLYGTGTCTYTFTTGNEPSIVWTDLDCQDSFSQEFDVKVNNQQTGEQDITDKNPETTFMMIPQNIENAVVEILFNDGTTDYTLTGKLFDQSRLCAENDGDLKTWDAGKIYTYAISTESINWTYVFDVTPSITFNLGQTSAPYTVTSYRFRTQLGDSEANREPVPWTAKNTNFSESNFLTGDKENITYNDVVTSFVYSGGASTDSFSKKYNLEVVGTKMHTTWDHDEKTLRGESSKGTPDNPYNLATDDGGDGNETTANCYVVNAAGYYKLPLVYGNALKNGTANTSAYSGGNFKDYKNKTINDPYINNADDATLVWSDGFYMFKDIKLDADKKYLTFHIDPNYLQQANAVLAVRDANDDIMWSWHIWVTERDINKTHSVKDWFDSSNTFELMSSNLGWVDGKTVYYNQRDIAYEFTQKGSGEKAEMVVKQEGREFDYKDVGSTYYQWGRKDPLVAMRNWDAVGADDYRLHETGRSDYGYDTQTGGITLGDAIQHPNIYYTRAKIEGGENWCKDNITVLWNNYDSGGQDESTFSIKTIYDPSPRGFKVPVPRAFAWFTKGTNGDGSPYDPNKPGTGPGELNGYQESNEGKYNMYRVYIAGNGSGESIPFTATGQRADATGLEVYTFSKPERSEIGGLWSMHGVYYWTCVPINVTSAYTFVVRKDPDGQNTANSYKFAGRKTMARPVRPIKDR